MAELGVAASVVGIISFGIGTAQSLLKYYGSWRGQDSDVADMCASLDSLSRTLAVLSETFRRQDPPSMSIQKRVVESVDCVNMAMKKLEDELEKEKNTESPKPEVRTALRRHVRRALYPFKEETLRKIQNAVSQARSDLDLILQVLHIESISDIRPEIKLLVRWKEDEETKSILYWLSPVNFWLKQEDVCKQREAGTGKWLLEHPDFLEWEKGNKEMLWCCGSPGVGKTVLASAIIEFLENDLSLPSIGLAFIYCKHKENLVQSVEYFLGAIVRQLVERRQTIPLEVRSRYERHRGKETNPTRQEYVDLLRLLAHEFSEVYVVIDALDECIDKNGYIIWHGLLSKLKSSVSNLRLLYTSRDIEDIAGILTGSTPIEIRASEADIQAYVQAQVKSTASLLSICEQDAELENNIPQAIASKAEGIFLAAQLYIEFLASKTNPRAVKKALNALPSTLNENYEEAMKRIERSPTKSLAFKVLKWIVYAVRPLQLEEVLHAMAVDELGPENESVTKDCLTPPSIIVNACAGMIRIDKESNVVSLVHKTTQEYFDKNGTNHFPHAHRDITTICITYLSLKEFESGACQNDNEFEQRLQLHKLYDYASHNWGYHARAASTLISEVNSFLQRKTQVEASIQALLAVKLYLFDLEYSQRFPKEMTGLHLAAFFGVKATVPLLLEKGADVNSKASDGRTPLHLASENGRVKTIQLLLEKGADVNSRASNGQTPLYLASKNGHIKTIQLLLEKGADISSRASDGRTLLHLASENGHVKTIQLLFEKGADVNSRASNGQTPLHLASKNGHVKTIQLLLGKGADISSRASDGRTPLHLASGNGHIKTSQLLLEKGADISSRASDGRTPLHLASENKHIKTIQLLLEKGADVNSKASDGQTPLYLASKNKHLEIVQLLLEKGADVNTAT